MEWSATVECIKWNVANIVGIVQSLCLHKWENIWNSLVPDTNLDSIEKLWFLEKWKSTVNT